jgi:putative hydrolase of the HAD superfamily
MPGPRVLLLDADGVLIQPPVLFSRDYAMRRGLDPAGFERFFRGDFVQALAGRADLQDLITKHHDVWRYHGDPADLITEWLAAEDHPNRPLLQLVGELRAAGLPVYVATSQEPYRASYLRDVMFPGHFDGFFISCDIGAVKSSDAFWRRTLEELADAHPGLQPADIIFFDDSRVHLETAARHGVQAELYQDVAQVRRRLAKT